MPIESCNSRPAPSGWLVWLSLRISPCGVKKLSALRLTPRSGMGDTQWMGSKSQMFEAGPPPKVSLEVFVKDLGVVVHPGCVDVVCTNICLCVSATKRYVPGRGRVRGRGEGTQRLMEGARESRGECMSRSNFTPWPPGAPAPGRLEEKGGRYV